MKPPVSLLRRSFLFLATLGAFALGRPAQARDDAPVNAAADADRAWLYAEIPLWDVADEGLPFRMTLALPSRHDVVAHMLLATETRWMVNAGYARVYNSYDAATQALKNSGDDAAIFGVARQYRWHPPEGAGPAIPKLVIEFGVHYGTRRFPADGTRLALQVVTGFEWTWRRPAAGPEWTAALIWPHFSNANLYGRNAGYDALALRVGRSLRF